MMQMTSEAQPENLGGDRLPLESCVEPKNECEEAQVGTGR